MVDMGLWLCLKTGDTLSQPCHIFDKEDNYELFF